MFLAKVHGHGYQWVDNLCKLLVQVTTVRRMDWPAKFGSLVSRTSESDIGNGRIIPLKLLHAVQTDSPVAGVQAFRKAFPTATIGEASAAFVELRAQFAQGYV